MNLTLTGSTAAVLIVLLAGCGESESTVSGGQVGPTPTVTAAPTPLPEAKGHYRGIAAMGGKGYHAEALLTDDGAVRLHIGGPGPTGRLEGGGGVDEELLDPAEAAQFVGTAVSMGTEIVASGVAVGQVCMPASVRLLCSAAAPAMLRLSNDETSSNGRNLGGELRVATSDAELVWSVSLSAWSIFIGGPPRQEHLAGTYRELLAPFAPAGDVAITVDKAGRLFFQSPASGCTGNGTATPRSPNGLFVFDVMLLVESCAADYAYLNGELEGLATQSQGGYWDYDTWLVMLLSTRDGAPSAAAVTMLAPLVGE